MMDTGQNKFRIGSVQYLNAVPLTRGIESEIVFTTPARLAEMLQRDELDAALVSITEVLLNDRYDILDGIAIASLGEVYSVILAHKKPIADATVIFCDSASLTSVNLLKVLLAEKNLFPQFKPLENYAAASERDFVLLIGDRAIDFQRASHAHEIVDLGSAVDRNDEFALCLCGLGAAARDGKQGIAPRVARGKKFWHGNAGLHH
jgi:chorismate dehydratase